MQSGTMTTDYFGVRQRLGTVTTPPTIVRAYEHAKRVVIDQGFATEIAWQSRIQLENVSEEHFLREAAWVVLSAGMKESVVRKVFRKLSDAFLEWRAAREIAINRPECVLRALDIFNHKSKIEAIADIAEQVYSIGFETLRKRIAQEGVSYLQTFPYIGPVTCFHLAKNIGLDVVKPDRHLIRAATATGYDSPEAMCEQIARWTGERVAIVDLVIWRFATLEPAYERVLSDYDVER